MLTEDNLREWEAGLAQDSPQHVLIAEIRRLRAEVEEWRHYPAMKCACDGCAAQYREIHRRVEHAQRALAGTGNGD